MAERSFKKEVEQLRIPAGEVFRGEGILAITKALLENGVGYVGGYQGAPISHLMDVLADAQDILSELGVRFESSASEASAAAMLAASVNYPIRGAVTFKSVVGTNVASDALANLASSGVKGGALVIVGEDYGEGSSILQERSQAFAMKSQIWLLDPRPNLTSMVQSVQSGFELSEASNTPVMLQLRIRACHVHGQFVTKANQAPPLTVEAALKEPQRDMSRIVLPPALFQHEQEKVNVRWPAAVDYIKQHQLNEMFGPAASDIGIIVQGGMYNTVIRALARLGLADNYGNSQVPIYVLNVTYPLIDEEFLEFCDGKTSVLLVEEGQPNFIEQAFSSMLYKAGLDRAGPQTKLVGKEYLPVAGEYTGAVVYGGIQVFLRDHAPDQLSDRARAPNESSQDIVAKELSEIVPPRPPGFCTGCPERPIFAAMKLVEEEMGQHQITSDIGCHLFSTMPPFEVGGTTMGFGLGAASNSAFDAGGEKRPISFIGDGGFWHNGLTSSIGNAVFNQSDSVVVVVDNYYSAATGGQDILSSRADSETRSTNNSIAGAVKGVGVDWVREIDRTYDVGKMRDTLKEALTTDANGPKVIVASSECMLNRQRRERPQRAAAIKAGQRVAIPKFGVDEDICTGDHACMRLSGCPSLGLKTLDDPLRDDPVAAIDQSCVGCGNCGEVADAAVLCPSFYQADTIENPGWFERTMDGVRKSVIGALQRWRERSRLSREDMVA